MFAHIHLHCMLSSWDRNASPMKSPQTTHASLSAIKTYTPPIRQNTEPTVAAQQAEGNNFQPPHR
jgi:hypothetical protein